MCPHTQTHTSWSCSPPSTVWLNQREREINLPEYSLVNPPGSWWEYASMVDVAAVEFTLKQINKASSEGVRVFVNERCSQWFLDCAAANRATASLQRGGLVLQIPLYSRLARLLKPTWHAEQQEIELWSALVCWADLLPHCSLIIQGPWNAPLFGPLQILRLWLAPGSAASQRFHLSRRGCECAHQHSHHYAAAICTHTI